MIWVIRVIFGHACILFVYQVWRWTVGEHNNDKHRFECTAKYSSEAAASSSWLPVSGDCAAPWCFCLDSQSGDGGCVAYDSTQALYHWSTRNQSRNLRLLFKHTDVSRTQFHPCQYKLWVYVNRKRTVALVDSTEIMPFLFGSGVFFLSPFSTVKRAIRPW